MVGIIISLLLGSVNSGASTALLFDAPAPSKLRCRISGMNIILGLHYGYCSGKEGAKYKLDVIGLGASLGLNSGFFKLKSLDGPFLNRERIDATRVGASAVIGGQYIRGNRRDAKDKKSDRIHGYMAGVGLGVTVDKIRIKLDRLR